MVSNQLIKDTSCLVQGSWLLRTESAPEWLSPAVFGIPKKMFFACAVTNSQSRDASRSGHPATAVGRLSLGRERDRATPAPVQPIVGAVPEWVRHASVAYPAHAPRGCEAPRSPHRHRRSLMVRMATSSVRYPWRTLPLPACQGAQLARPSTEPTVRSPSAILQPQLQLRE